VQEQVGPTPPGERVAGKSARRHRASEASRRASGREEEVTRFSELPPTNKLEGYIATELRINDRIRVPRVRVVDADGTQVGIMATPDALKLAEEQDLDLVEVAAQADPPVARIMDYGKYKYEQAVRQREARKKQSHVVVKEMKMRPKIDRHDYETKKGHVVRFLKQGAKVKVTIMFRGREMIHPEIGRQLLERLSEDVVEIAKIETSPKLDGRNMTMVLAPLKEAVQQKPATQAPKPRPRREQQETAPEGAEPESVTPSRPIKVTRAEGG
jgi:translation initiation factor IF-3